MTSELVSVLMGYAKPAITETIRDNQALRSFDLTD